MDLDTRKQRVLRAIVTEYVRTAEPVGSERLAEAHDIRAKAATIRNEMSALSQMGFVVQPHTSAGRIPSDLGYRFYVDRLVDEDYAAPRVPRARFREELDEVLRQTCRILADLTHCAAVVTPPRSADLTVQQIHVTPVTDTRALLVVLLSSGEVEHRILDVGMAVSAALLTQVSNLLNEQLGGLTLSAARQAMPSPPPHLSALGCLVARLTESVAEALERDATDEGVLEGATRVLREPEYADDTRRERLLRALEDRREVLESLRAMDRVDGDVEVTIGAENPLPGMREFSFVSSRYHVGGRLSGFVGIFGPTRMAYSRTIPAVRLVARMLGDTLTRLSADG